VLKFKALVDREEDVEPSLYLWDENVIPLAGLAQISNGFDGIAGESRAKASRKSRINAFEDD
jgi:hypothetical protein